MKGPWTYYSPIIARRNMVAAFCLLFMVSFGWAAPAAQLEIRSGPGQVAGLHWDSLDISYLPDPDVDGTWEISVAGIIGPGEVALGELLLHCRQSRSPVTAGCRQARLRWQHEELVVDWPLAFALRQDVDGWHFDLQATDWSLQARLPPDGIEGLGLQLTFDELSIAELAENLADRLGLAMLDARLDGYVMIEEGRLKAALTLTDLGFDSLDGLMAGEGVQLEATMEADLLQPEMPFSVGLVQRAGEVLAGPVYLPAPQAPLTVDVVGRRTGAGRFDIDNLRLIDPDALDIAGSAQLDLDEEGGPLSMLALDRVVVQLPGAFERWADGPAGAAGFAGLETSGWLTGSLSWQAVEGISWSGSIDEVTLIDPNGRLALEGISGELGWHNAGPSADLGWESLSLYGLPLRRARVRLASGANGPKLLEPLRLPLLDGAFVFDHLVWDRDENGEMLLGFDARIEPLSLTALTRQLEFPEFGGTLSGEFPGVQVSQNQISFTGGIDIQAFSGHITIADLSIERPFGTLPALAAQVTFSRLDLLELTGAFNFGRMEGQASGWMRDLRLLDWRPVAMDARVFTHEDVPRRRISQRAVNNLSSLGGAGGALISGTILRVFEDFPYRRVGLACRLSNNICHIDGVARHESGGFYIVEGRALPRLDIIGHRRLVDWPQLMSQLEAMIE